MAYEHNLRENPSLIPVSELHDDRPLQEHYVDEVKGVLIPYRQIRERVDAIARQLHMDYAKSDVLFIWLREGAKRFKDELGDSIEQQGFRLRYAPLPLTATSYHGNSSTGRVVIDESELAVIRDYLHEHREISEVVGIEDIVDTGLTMSRVVRDVLALRQYPPVSFSICTLLDKPERRLEECKWINGLIQHAGFRIHDIFVIGFGLDYNDRYRDMHHIGVPTEEAIVKYRK